MILKTATLLYKTISAYWYTFNQGIQIHVNGLIKRS